jgi:hypothetical protein
VVVHAFRRNSGDVCGVELEERVMPSSGSIQSGLEEKSSAGPARVHRFCRNPPRTMGGSRSGPSILFTGRIEINF